MNIGSSNRLIYDNCAYQKRLYESTAPLDYQLYQGKFENCKKCVQDKFWTPYKLVDIETELRNQNRPATHCDLRDLFPVFPSRVHTVCRSRRAQTGNTG